MRTLAGISMTLLLAGCATATETYWDRPGGGGNPAEFDRDYAACQAQSNVGGVVTGGQNLYAYAINLNLCLRGKGWQLYERPKR